MGDAMRRLRLAIVSGILGATALAATAAAEPIVLEVRDADDNPVVAVTVGETPDPKGIRYDVSTTLGAGAAARSFHLGFTRKGSQWVVDSLDGLKGGPFKKLTSIANSGWLHRSSRSSRPVSARISSGISCSESPRCPQTCRTRTMALILHFSPGSA